MLAAAIFARDVDAPPFAAHFFVMDLRIVDAIDRADFGNAQPANRSDDRIGCHQNIAFGGFELDLRLQQFLLRVQNFDQRALTNFFFFAYAVQRRLVRRDLRLVGFALCPEADQLRPSLRHLRLGARARLLDFLNARQMRLFGLANTRVHFAAVGVNRNIQPADNRSRLSFVERARRVETVRVGCLDLSIRQQLAADLINLKASGLFGVERTNNGRIFARPDGNRLVQRARQQFRMQVRFRKILRGRADDLQINGAERIQIGSRQIEVRLTECKARFSL